MGIVDSTGQCTAGQAACDWLPLSSPNRAFAVWLRVIRKRSASTEVESLLFNCLWSVSYRQVQISEAFQGV